MKRLLTRDEYLDTLRTQNYTKYTSIPKTSEAFSNDVNWGDSWVGRLVNSIARKAKISFNLRKISSLSKRLEGLFQELVETGKIQCNNFDRKFLETKYLLDSLQTMIDSNPESDVDDLISHVDMLIAQVLSYNLKNSELLISKLEEFNEYLKGLIKSGVKGSDSSSEKEETVGKSKSLSNVDLDISELNDSFYKSSRNLLQSIVDIHSLIKGNVIKFKGEEYGKVVNAGTHFDISKFNELKLKYEKATKEIKTPLLRQLVQMCEDGLDSYKAKKDTSNINLFNQYFKKYSGLLSGLERENRSKLGRNVNNVDVDKDVKDVKNDNVLDLDVRKNTSKSVSKQNASYSYLKEAQANLESNEENAKNAWKKVVNAYTKSNISRFIPEIETLLKTSLSEGKEKFKESKSNILKICKQVVLNENSTGKPIEYEDLISENLYVNDIPKSISLFGRIILSYKGDLGLLGAYGSAISPLRSFIKSFDEMKVSIKDKLNVSDIKKDITEKEFKAGDVVKYRMNDGGESEKEIERVDGDKIVFLDKDGKEFTKSKSDILESILIMEATEGVNYDDVALKFDEIFTDDIKEMFNISQEIANKIKSEGKEENKFIITTADPIIEIVRLFNRAWRLHTPGRIPSGRTGGKVSSMVFSEYENLGDSSGDPDNPGNGPYRNIELYEKWQESILNILGNSKYRTTIFSDDAEFSFNYDGKEENVKMDKDDLGQFYDRRTGDKVPKPLGKILLRFINNLLTDTQMYKDKGAMPKFLQEYFGLGDDQVKNLGGITFNGAFKKDVDENISASLDMKEQVKVRLIKSGLIKNQLDNKRNIIPVIKSNSDDLKNLVMRLKSEDGKMRYLYYIGNVKNEKLYFYMIDRYYFDFTFAKPEGIGISGEPKFVHLVEVDVKDEMIQGKPFKFKKSTDFKLKDDNISMSDESITIIDIDILVRHDNKKIYLDSKFSRGFVDKYKLKNKTKMINSKLIL